MMGAPQIIMICLWGIALGAAMVEHGKPKTGNNNAFYTMTGIVINTALLFWGGFFRVGW